MERVMEVHEAVGKTIKAIVGYGDEYLVAFTDKSFLVFSIERDYDDIVDIIVNSPDINRYQLVKAGLMTEEAYEEERETERSLRKRKAEEADRRIYEMLKARFEK